MAARPGCPTCSGASTTFQFQSTVFPAVSIIDLDEEKERVDERKQLFLQINLPSVGNRSQIVSNPFAARFAADGKRVYLTWRARKICWCSTCRAAASRTATATAARSFRGCQGDPALASPAGPESARSADRWRPHPGAQRHGAGSHPSQHRRQRPFARVTVDVPHFAKLVETDPRPRSPQAR